jgi:hypothetical protein
MYNYEDIRDELKKYKYVIYNIKNNKFEQGIKFKGKKSELIEKLEKKKNVDFYVCFKFGFHTGTKPLQGGPLSITISTFLFINNELKNGFTHDNKCKQFNGKVWFQKKYLEKFGWSDKYLETIITKLINNKAKINPLVVNMYNVEFL